MVQVFHQLFCFVLDGRSCKEPNSKVGCVVSQANGHGCYGDYLSPILVESICKGDISLTSRSADFFNYNPHPCGQAKEGKFVPMLLAILLGLNLDVQQGLFKLTMKSNATQAMAKVVTLASNKVNLIIVNPFTHM